MDRKIAHLSYASRFFLCDVPVLNLPVGSRLAYGALLSGDRQHNPVVGELGDAPAFLTRRQRHTEMS